MKPRLLDLFCCAGGAAMGYHRAGFEVVGVDIRPQPRYPFGFIEADAIDYVSWLLQRPHDLRTIAAIHASPPCQFATELRHAPGAKEHANLIPATRRLLARSGKPYIIENVEGAREHLNDPVLLCGSMFGLGATGKVLRFHLQRHRYFETNFPLSAPRECYHMEPVIGVYGGHVRCRSAKHGGRRTRDFEGHDKPELAREAMQMTWATMQQMSEAIPPAYTEFIGQQLLASIEQDRKSSMTGTPIPVSELTEAMMEAGLQQTWREHADEREGLRRIYLAMRALDPVLAEVREAVREVAETLSIEGQLKAPLLSKEARLRSVMDRNARTLFAALRSITAEPGE